MTKKQAEIVFDIAIARFGYGVSDPQEHQDRYEACIAFGKLIDSSGFGEDSELLDWMEANPRLIVASTGYRGAKDSWCWRDVTSDLCTNEAPSLRAAIKAAREKSRKALNND